MRSLTIKTHRLLTAQQDIAQHIKRTVSYSRDEIHPRTRYSLITILTAAALYSLTSAKGLLGTASSAATLAASSPMVRPTRNLARIVLIGHRRDQALHLLLPRPLRHPPLQDSVDAAPQPNGHDAMDLFLPSEVARMIPPIIIREYSGTVAE